MQSFTKRLKAIFSQRDPPKEKLADKRVAKWIEKRKKHFDTTKKEVEKLIEKYQLQPDGKPIEYALMDLPPLINGVIPNTICILIVNAENFETIVKGENVKDIDMLFPDKKIFAQDQIKNFFI